VSEKEFLTQILKVGLALAFTLLVLYFLLPYLIGRKTPLKGKKGNIELEGVLPVGKDVFLLQVKLGKKRLYLIVSPSYAVVLHEERADDGTSS